MGNVSWSTMLVLRKVWVKYWQNSDLVCYQGTPGVLIILEKLSSRKYLVMKGDGNIFWRVVLAAEKYDNWLGKRCILFLGFWHPFKLLGRSKWSNYRPWNWLPVSWTDLEKILTHVFWSSPTLNFPWSMYLSQTSPPTNPFIIPSHIRWNCKYLESLTTSLRPWKYEPGSNFEFKRSSPVLYTSSSPLQSYLKKLQLGFPIPLLWFVAPVPPEPWSLFPIYSIRDLFHLSSKVLVHHRSLCLENPPGSLRCIDGRWWRGCSFHLSPELSQG